MQSISQLRNGKQWENESQRIAFARYYFEFSQTTTSVSITACIQTQQKMFSIWFTI
jgi:hypothetical protein